jgi:CHASE2 domain-containing sensor protein
MKGSQILFVAAAACCLLYSCVGFFYGKQIVPTTPLFLIAVGLYLLSNELHNKE